MHKIRASPVGELSETLGKVKSDTQGLQYSNNLVLQIKVKEMMYKRYIEESKVAGIVMWCVQINDPSLLSLRSNYIEVPNIKITKQGVIIYTTRCKTIRTKRRTLGEGYGDGGARGCKAGQREEEEGCFCERGRPRMLSNCKKKI